MRTNNRFVFVLIILVLLLAACSSSPPKCPVTTLILNESLLPEGTHAEPLESPLPEYPNESAAQTFYYAPSDDAVFHEVVNWRSVRAAKKEFDLHAKSAFDVDKYMGPWSAPSDLYISSIASNYQAACGVDGKIYQCRMVATYGGYSVFFRSYVSEQGITLQKVNEFLQFIDKRMSQCIG